jgi:hypothetical protein
MRHVSKKTVRLRVFLKALTAAFLMVWAGTVAAQTIEFSAIYPTGAWTGPSSPDPGNRRLEVVFAGVAVEGKGTAGLRLAAGDELELGLRLREAGSLATVGNLVFELAADGSTGDRYALAMGARGVLGPLALRLRGSVSDGDEPLAPLPENYFGPLPRLGPGPALLGLEVGGIYRVSRRVIVDAAPALFLRSGELGGRLTGEVRLIRAVGDDDLSFLLHAFGEPGLARATSAVGLGYNLNRRRAPSWSASAWFGWNGGTPLPGLRLKGSDRLADGRATVELALEPYRLDAWPYRALVGFDRDLGSGELRLGLDAGLEPSSGWRLAARVGYRVPKGR